MTTEKSYAAACALLAEYFLGQPRSPADVAALAQHVQDAVEGWLMGKPACPYCGTLDGLRVKCGGGGYIAPEYTCEACFKGADDGPCFDDLMAVA